MPRLPWITRRGFLLGSAGTVAALGHHAPSRADDSARARNVIIFCADGLSPSALAMADVAHRATHGESLLWVRWLQQLRDLAWVRTEPADLLVTDSAAAASAWSIGSRVNNGALCVLPDGSAPMPLLARLAQEGFETGLLTTTLLHDASPAAMVANTDSRLKSAEIMQQYANSDLSFVIGGGLADWRMNTPRNIDRATVITDWRELGRLRAGRRQQYALLAPSDLPSAMDRRGSFPTFTQLVEQAIELGSGSGERFALFLENEHTDTLSHYNDAAALVRELQEVDRALAALRAFVEHRDDTLLIVLTDHGNSGPNFTLRSHDAPEHVARLLGAKRSLLWIMEQFQHEQERTGTTLAKLVQQGQGVALTEHEIDVLDAWIRDEPVDPFALRNYLYCPLGSVLGNHFGTAFVSAEHTAELVPVAAMGPGSELIRGAAHHVDVHKAITQALGIHATA